MREEYTKDLFAMGTYITMTAYGEPAEDALEISEERIKELEALWSVIEESSDICKMNQSNDALDSTISGYYCMGGLLAENIIFLLKMIWQIYYNYVDYKKVTLRRKLCNSARRNAIGNRCSGERIYR